MKEGKIYTKVVLWIFLLAVVCYFGYYVVSAIYAPLTTAAAIEYEAGTGSYTTGYVVRDEEVIRSVYGITNIVVSEGERVSRGQTLATGYRSADAQNRQSAMEELENQLEQLKYAASYSAAVEDQAVLDAEIYSQLVHMSKYVARRDMNSAAERSAAVKGLIMRRMSSEEVNAAVDQRIESLNEELKAMREDTDGDTMSVQAPGSGCFSGNVDGYENVLTLEVLANMTVESFGQIQPLAVSDVAVGKLISGSTWYYVTVVPTAQTEGVRAGKQIPVSFSSDFYDDLVMEVERIGPDENGSRLLVLSCDRYMQDATLLRQQSADVVFTSYKGLRVPKEAIRVLTMADIQREEAEPGEELSQQKYVGVFVLEGSTAVWKNIEILYDNGESYVVAMDKTSTDNLWPGDEIIVGAKNLYDGKVVR